MKLSRGPVVIALWLVAAAVVGSPLAATGAHEVRPAVNHPWKAEPLPAPAANAGLAAVAALSSNDAWAVGKVIDHWNGTSWSQFPGAPLTTTETNVQLNAVATVPGSSPTHLWAVGGVFSGEDKPEQSYVENYNGTAWNTVKSPAGTFLDAVTALSPTDAWAAGQTAVPQEPAQPFVVHWNGHQWATVPMPTFPSGARVLAVHAVSANDVWFVGAVNDASHHTLPWAEHWNGVTFSQAAVNHAGTAQGALNAITSVPGSSALVAVGDQFNSAASPTALIVRLVGSSWQQLKPATIPEGSDLTGVTAFSVANILAVGYTGSANLHGLSERFNGFGWKAVGVDTRTLNEPELFGVSAIPGGTTALAAGGDTEMWNGSRWLAQPSPNRGLEVQGNSLAALKQGAGTDAWVGGEFVFRRKFQVFVDQWSHGEWTSLGFPAGTDSQLANGVAATSPSNVWVSVFDLPSVGPDTAFIANWNGSAWTEVPMPSSNAPVTQFSAIAVLKNGTVWVAGESDNQAILDSWDGSKWTQVTCNVPADSEFSSLQVISPTDVWAAGSYSTNSGQAALLAQSDGATCPKVEAGAIKKGHFTGVASIVGTSDANLWTAGSTGNDSASNGLLVHIGSGAHPTSAILKSTTELSAVALAPANGVWLGGRSTTEQPVIEKLNSTTFIPNSLPIHTSSGAINAVTEVRANQTTWAIGSATAADGVSQAIAFRRTH